MGDSVCVCVSILYSKIDAIHKTHTIKKSWISFEISHSFWIFPDVFVRYSPFFTLSLLVYQLFDIFALIYSHLFAKMEKLCDWLSFRVRERDDSRMIVREFDDGGGSPNAHKWYGVLDWNFSRNVYLFLILISNFIHNIKLSVTFLNPLRPICMWIYKTFNQKC